MTNEKESRGVNIGNITGEIHSSIIAGGDVKHATISLGGQPTPAEKEPSTAELQQLLAEIQLELAQITAQQEVLHEISPAASLNAQGAQLNIKDVTDKVTQEMKPEEAKSVQQRLTESVTLLGAVLDGAKTLAEKAGNAASAAQPLIDKLVPLVEKIGVAAFWVAKIWLQTGG